MGSPNHRDLFNALTAGLLSSRYVGDAHYLFVGEGTDPRAVKITDYLASNLRICEGRLPDQKLRREALERGESFIVIECGNPSEDIYASGIPETLRTDGLVSGHLLTNTPPEWPTDEPLTWAVKLGGQHRFIPLEQPIQGEDHPRLLNIYRHLGSAGTSPA